MFNDSKNKFQNIERAFPYFETKSFQQHKKKIERTLSTLPYQEEPNGWMKYSDIAVGGLEYVGFSKDSKYMLVISSSGRGIIELNTCKKIARDYDNSRDWLDERRLLCKGFDVLENQVLSVSGIGGGRLPNGSGCGESLYLASTMYPCHDIIYAPNFEHCLLERHNKNCTILYRGFVNYYGFSPDGNIMLVIDEDVHLWKRKEADQI